MDEFGKECGWLLIDIFTGMSPSAYGYTLFKDIPLGVEPRLFEIYNSYILKFRIFICAEQHNRKVGGPNFFFDYL